MELDRGRTLSSAYIETLYNRGVTSSQASQLRRLVA
jgi:hypothetical protein